MPNTRLLPIGLFTLLATTAACSQQAPTVPPNAGQPIAQQVSDTSRTVQQDQVGRTAPGSVRRSAPRTNVRITYPRPTPRPTPTQRRTRRRTRERVDYYPYYYPYDYSYYPGQYVPYSNVQVVIRNYQFNPSVIRVPVGGTVTWINQDSVTHTSTAPLPGSVTTTGAWDGVVQPGASFTYTFNVPGSFDYYCRIHPSMRGTVIVGG